MTFLIQCKVAMLGTLYLALVLLSFSSSAKEQPPSGSEPNAFQVPETHDITLANGLKITFIPYGSTPKTTIRLVTYTGNVDDGNTPWLADLSYEMLKQGTKNHQAKALAESIASMGGTLNVSVGMDSSWIGTDVLSEFSTDALVLIADAVLNSNLSDDDLQRIKKDYQRQLKVALSQPGNMANQAFYHAIFGQHPYGQLYPSQNSLEAITAEDISGFVNKKIAPNRSHLFISGVFDAGRLSAQIERLFASWPYEKEDKSPVLLTKSGSKIKIIERKNAPQSTIRLGLTTVGADHQDAFKLSIMNTLLGGAFSSRITSNIREDKGFTYSPYSTVVNRIGAGLWYQAADITAESTGAALTEIFNEINRLAKTPPTDEELDGIKNYTAGIFVLQNSSRGAIINQLSKVELYGLADEYLKDYVAKIYDVTPQDISDMAKKYLSVEKMVLVVIGDKGELEPQLKAVEALKGYW
jgi:predicted Zn-dependent peptidase